MATLHIPYYRSDVPVVRYTNNINSGVMVIQPHDHINYISGTLLTPTSNYFKTTDSQNTYSSILCKSNDKRLGSFDLPDKNQDGSHVLTYSNHEAKYTWTNIEDIALSKYITMSLDKATLSPSCVINENSNKFKYDSSNYVYNVIIDADIVINIDTSNDIVKSKSSNLFIAVNGGESFDTSLISDYQTFCKYTINVTDTSTTQIHINKFIPDFNFIFKEVVGKKIPQLCLTLFYRTINNTSYDKSQFNTFDDDTKSFNITGTITITENLNLNKTLAK